MLRLFAARGVPEFVRSDNGPEFVAQAPTKMLVGRGVSCRHIDPGGPWPNGRNERFNGSFRDECLNLETFVHRDQARAVSAVAQPHEVEVELRDELRLDLRTAFALTPVCDDPQPCTTCKPDETTLNNAYGCRGLAMFDQH